MRCQEFSLKYFITYSANLFSGTTCPFLIHFQIQAGVTSLTDPSTVSPSCRIKEKDKQNERSNVSLFPEMIFFSSKVTGEGIKFITTF